MKKLILIFAALALTGCLSEGGGGSSSSAPSAPDLGGGNPPANPPVNPPVTPPVNPPASPPPAQPPTITIQDALTGVEGSPIVLNLIGFDPAGNPLTYSCQSGCVGGVTSNVFSWTPGYADAGSHNISFRVSNGTDYADYSGTIVVVNTNRAPSLTAMPSASVMEQVPVSITPSATDADGDSLSIAMTSGAVPNASFSGGVLNFTPAMNQSGQFTFTFQVSDGALTDTKSFVVNVSNVNQAPALNAIGAKTTEEQTNISFTVAASDADGDAMTLSATGLPSGASLNTTTGAFTWTPSCTQEGSYNVTFQVSDGNLTDSEVVAFTVTHKNCSNPSWFGGAASKSSESGETVNIAGGNGQDSDGAVTYGYVAEYDCNNRNWSQTFNVTTRALQVVRTNVTDAGTHRFLIYAQDSDGVRAYRMVTVVKSGGVFLVSSTDSGTSYSTTGICGAGTVYTH